METAEIRFYKLLKKNNFSDEDAGEFIALHKEMQLEDLASKTDIADIKSELRKMEATLTWRIFMFWLAQIGVFLAFAYKIFPGI